MRLEDHKLHIMRVGDGNFILKTSEYPDESDFKQGIIIDAGTGKKQPGAITPKASYSELIDLKKKLEDEKIRITDIIFYHQHTDHFNYVKKNKYLLTYLQKEKPNIYDSGNVKGFNPKDLTDEDKIHSWNTQSVTDGAPLEKSFKIGEKLTAAFDSSYKAEIAGVTFAKGITTSNFDEQISLGRERITIVSPSSFGSSDRNSDSLSTVSQYRGIKQVFPGDGTPEELEDFNKRFHNLFKGTDMFVPPPSRKS